jgi:hypothetical protein
MRRSDQSTEIAMASWFAVLLWVAFTLLDLSIYSVMREPPLWTDSRSSWLPDYWFRSLARGALTAQIALICIVTVWTQINFVVRFVGGGLYVWGLAHIVSVPREADIPHYFGTLILYYLVILGPLVITRLCGLIMIRSERELVADSAKCHVLAPSPRRRSIWQFSTGDLLGITTAIAIATAAMQFADFRLPEILEFWQYFVLLAVSPIAVIGTTLYAWRSVQGALTIVAPVTITIICAMIDFYRRHAPAEWAEEMITDILVNCTMAGAAALVMRIAGVRFVWRARKKGCVEEGLAADSVPSGLA